MSDPSKPKADYAVGYGKPPLHSRFQKGHVGNPTGRRKGQPGAQELIMREAARLVKVKRGDGVETVTKLEVVVRQLWQMAMKGELQAIRLLFTVMDGPSLGSGEGEVEDELATLSLPAQPDEEVIRRMLARFQHLAPPKEGA